MYEILSICMQFNTFTNNCHASLVHTPVAVLPPRRDVSPSWLFQAIIRRSSFLPQAIKVVMAPLLYNLRDGSHCSSLDVRETPQLVLPFSNSWRRMLRICWYDGILKGAWSTD